MNSIERVQAAFQQRETDRVPLMHVGFSSQVASALLGREAYVGGGIQQWREAQALWQGDDAHEEFLERSYRDAIDLADLCEVDIVRVAYWRYPKKPTRRIDVYTFLYAYGPEEEWQVLRCDPDSEQCIIAKHKPGAEPTADDLEEEVAGEETATAAYRPTEADFALEIRAHRSLGHQRVIRVFAAMVGILPEPRWLEAIALRPDLVARLLDTQVEKAARNVRFLAALGFRYFFGGYDLASLQGPLYSPRLFRDVVLPRVKRVADLCHQSGGHLLFGSDGNVWPLADALFGESGVDGYYEVDADADMSLTRLRQQFPRLTLLGNLSTTFVYKASKNEVKARTLACLEEAKACKGVIVGASNYVAPNTPIENVLAVLETIKKYR